MTGERHPGAGRGPTLAGLVLVATIAVVMALYIAIALVDGGLDRVVMP